MSRSTTKEKEPTTSWADETEDYEETVAKPKEANAWAKGNPLVAPPKKNDEGYVTKDMADFPEPKGVNKNEPKRQESSNYVREEERSYAGSNVRKEDYPRERGDYRAGRDNFRREEREYPQREWNGQRNQERGGYGGGGDRERYPREDRNYGRRDDDRQARPPRAERPPVPFPTEPPFTAFIGNLPFDVRQDDLLDFFGQDCKVSNVRLLTSRETNKPKGFGYVEFGDLDSLKRAVARNGEVLLDRPLRIDVAEAKSDENRDRGAWKSHPGDRERPPKAFVSPAYGSSFNRGDSDQEPQRERPKLDLKPRSEVTPNQSDNIYQNAKFNPFGDAKPRDESVFLKKMEDEKKKREFSDDSKKLEGEGSGKESIKSIEPDRNQEVSAISSNNHTDNNLERKENDRREPKRDRRPRQERGDKVERGGYRAEKDREEKPFVRGARAPNSFKNDDRPKQKKEVVRREREDRPRALPQQQVKHSDVTTPNLFSALNDENGSE